MKNLYTFSKNSWHVRFFKWIFNSDPTELYKTMCPYFWTYVVVVLILPIILIVKLFGKGGTEVLNGFRTYKERKEKRLFADFEKRVAAAETPEQVYHLMRSRCWQKFKWSISWDIKEKLEEKYAHRHKLNVIEDEKEREAYDLKLKRQRQYQQTKDSFKESKVVNFIGYVILYSAIALLAYGVFKLIQWLCSLNYPEPNWPLIGFITGLIVAGAVAIFIVYLIFRYMIVPFFSWVICQLGKVNWSFLSYLSYLKYIGIPFWLIYKGFALLFKLFAIIGSMMYATYKKHCPRITWKE